MSLILRNPHSVLAALETRPSDVQRVSLPNPVHSKGSDVDSPWARVEKLARQKGIIIGAGASPKKDVNRRDSRDLGKRDPDEGGRMGLAEAMVVERASVPVERLFANAKERKEGKGLWIALDCLQDPHNVGAIFRAAAFFGVEGILMTQERSAPLTGTVYDVASGGMEYVPFTVQANLQRGFEVAKEMGLWILGTSEHTNDDLRTIQRDRPWLLVLGNEETGMRRLTGESCDLLCKISQQGKVGSLNVSVAAGIFISHLTR